MFKVQQMSGPHYLFLYFYHMFKYSFAFSQMYFGVGFEYFLFRIAEILEGEQSQIRANSVCVIFLALRAARKRST